MTSSVTPKSRHILCRGRSQSLKAPQKLPVLNPVPGCTWEICRRGKSGRVVNSQPGCVLVLWADNRLTGDGILTIVPICSPSGPRAIVSRDKCDRGTKPLTFGVKLKLNIIIDVCLVDKSG